MGNTGQLHDLHMFLSSRKWFTLATGAVEATRFLPLSLFVWSRPIFVAADSNRVASIAPVASANGPSHLRCVATPHRNLNPFFVIHAAVKACTAHVNTTFQSAIRNFTIGKRLSLLYVECWKRSRNVIRKYALLLRLRLWTGWTKGVIVISTGTVVISVHRRNNTCTRHAGKIWNTMRSLHEQICRQNLFYLPFFSPEHTEFMEWRTWSVHLLQKKNNRTQKFT